jgi:predicted metal-dependent phosphoesterase TrpH
VIDLHLHTTASDGRSTPEALVDEAGAAGITTLAVTDHDTMAAQTAVRAAARPRGIQVVPGVEITAVYAQRDVHMLGYFLDSDDPALGAFLDEQRDDRRRRLVEMALLLSRLGVPVNVAALLESPAAASGKSLGRPLLAAALVAAGHVPTTRDAFDRYLSEGRPAFVERCGRAPGAVIDLIDAAGGIASLAHPGKLAQDRIIPSLVASGLPAIEVYHSDHDSIDVRRYQSVARQYGLLVTGGSDYHGPGSGRTEGLGRVHLPNADFERLAARAGWSGAEP